MEKDLNMKNENVHDLKRSGKEPLPELKISQSFKLIVKDDVIVTERKVNANDISRSMLEIAFWTLRVQKFLVEGGVVPTRQGLWHS